MVPVLTERQNIVEAASKTALDTPQKSRRRTSTPDPPHAYQARKMYLASVDKDADLPANVPRPYPFKSPRLREAAEWEVARVVASAADVEEAMANARAGKSRVLQHRTSGGR